MVTGGRKHPKTNTFCWKRRVRRVCEEDYWVVTRRVTIFFSPLELFVIASSAAQKIELCVLGAPCASRKCMAFGQNPVGCWVMAWKVFRPPSWRSWLNFRWHVMEDSDFARVSVSRSPDKSNGQKMMSSTKIPTSHHFGRKKKGWDTVLFLCGYVDYNQILKKCMTIQESTEKKVKKHVYIFYLHANIIYYNSNNSNALT